MFILSKGTCQYGENSNLDDRQGLSSNKQTSNMKRSFLWSTSSLLWACTGLHVSVGEGRILGNIVIINGCCRGVDLL